MSKDSLLERIAAGRTDLVWDALSQGFTAFSGDADGVSLLNWCAYYGDVSAMRFLIGEGASLSQLGTNFGLEAAAFHGHWRLCEYLLENGSKPNAANEKTGETALHAALCTCDREAHDLVLKVLLSHGADPNCVTKPAVETGSFMRDCRTKAETPLHRAAAFGTERTVELLMNAGAARDAKDMHGDTPLSWASWYGRPDTILRQLCYGEFSIRAGRVSMRQALLGSPHRST